MKQTQILASRANAPTVSLEISKKPRMVCTVVVQANSKARTNVSNVLVVLVLLAQQRTAEEEADRWPAVHARGREGMSSGEVKKEIPEVARRQISPTWTGLYMAPDPDTLARNLKCTEASVRQVEPGMVILCRRKDVQVGDEGLEGLEGTCARADGKAQKQVFCRKPGPRLIWAPPPSGFPLGNVSSACLVGLRRSD